MDDGYPIASEALDLEAYTLAALVAGSAVLRREERGKMALAWARRTFEYSEISRRLVGLAVLLRSTLDATGRDGSDVVGELVADVDHPEVIADLTLREACNKIIHARQVDLSPGPVRELPPVGNRFVLEGQYRDKVWRATLDVFTFLGSASLRF